MVAECHGGAKRKDKWENSHWTYSDKKKGIRNEVLHCADQMISWHLTLLHCNKDYFLSPGTSDSESFLWDQATEGTEEQLTLYTHEILQMKTLTTVINDLPDSISLLSFLSTVSALQSICFCSASSACISLSTYWLISCK